MKPGNSAAVAMTVAACISLTGLAFGGPGKSGNAPGRSGMTPRGIGIASSHVKTSPTPPGKHLGWQKGRHNPHATPTP